MRQPMTTPQTTGIVPVVAMNTLRVALRDRTVLWLALLFLAMVVLSAYLGWSATNTVNHIYTQALPMLRATGLPVPPNPLADMPPLAMLRNMTTYISLLGALVAIVMGFQIIAEDLRSGVFPLIASRPLHRAAYAGGKMLALSWGKTNVNTNQAVTGTSSATDSERLHAADPIAMRPNAERNSQETL